MVKLKYNGHVLEMYDSIEELPITRFQMYNLNLVVDAGIGSDLNGFDARCNNIRRLMSSDAELASREITNLQQNLRFIMSQTSPELNSFVVMIRRIDGREVTDEDLTDQGIRDIIEELGRKRLTIDKVRDFMRSLKKKIDFEFETFFPGVIDTPKLKEFYTKLKQRTLLVLRNLQIDDEKVTEQIRVIDEYLFGKVKPGNYHGTDGIEANMVRGFEETCILLHQYNVSNNPRGMTTLAFHQALAVVREQLKDKRKKTKQRK